MFSKFKHINLLMAAKSSAIRAKQLNKNIKMLCGLPSYPISQIQSIAFKNSSTHIRKMEASDNNINDNNSSNNGSNSTNSSSSDNSNNSENPNNSKSKQINDVILNTLPIQNWKATNLTQEELKVTPTTHIVFSSKVPILPHSKVACQMKTGNLQEIKNELAYFMVDKKGEIYQVGFELEKTVSKVLAKQLDSLKEIMTNNNLPPINEKELSVELVPNKNRVKIIELEVSNKGIFAKTIPYKDNKQTIKIIDKLNLQRELFLVRSLVMQIKKSISYEKIEAFGQQDIETASLSDATPDQIDKLLFQIIGGIQKLYSQHLKEDINHLIQTIIQARSYGERVILMRIHLESLNDIMELVNKNFKMADDNLIRMQTQARARMSIEYIRQNFLGEERSQQSQQRGFFSGMGGQQNSLQQKLIKQYISKLHLIEDTPSREKVKQEIERFNSIDKNSSEYNKINTYLDDVFNVPWNKFTPSNWDVSYAKRVLDEEIYGLEKVKERIIEMIAVNQIKNVHSKSKGFILLLQGPPGTGKTSIAKAIAKALQKESRFISFAGISDVSFFKGHRRTYVDSQPGVFIKELIKAQTMNPVMILDEIDKISKSHMGADPYYSLMEILNPEENHNFNDHYLDIKVDFSNTIFILTANEIMSMLDPLKNRLEIIEIPAYIEEEKLEISKKYIIPKAIASNGINKNLFKINDQTISCIIQNWCYQEAGVRSLKRCFESISRKYAVELLSNNSQLVEIQQKSQQEANIIEKEVQDEVLKKINEPLKDSPAPNSQEVSSQPQNQTINEEQFQSILSDQTVEQLNLPTLDLTQQLNQLEVLKKYLGVPTFDSELDSRSATTFIPGVVNIMSVGGFVGRVMKIECVFDNSQIEKKGTFTSSGNLKQVLQESLTIAKINSFNYIPEEKKKLLQEKNVHIHFMSGSIPKDGPSAGIAICTAYISLITGRPVPATIAMTGELSTLGEVCKIGGLQAKIIAAKTLNIDQIICPYSNLSDVHEFPKLLLKNITIYFVREYKQVYEIVFEEKRGSHIPKGVVVLKNGEFLNNSIDLSFHSNNNGIDSATSSSMRL